MCEYVSFVATTEGSLEIYVAPGLDSHGEARAGWNIRDGAECEWTGEGPESLAIRFEDEKSRAVVKALILEKYPNRTALIHSITETRKANGERHWYKDGVLHRAGDKPAIECADGDRYWYRNDKLHRAGDKPAVEGASGTRCWYKDGVLHRDGDKPAIEYANGARYWYKNGVAYTPKSK